MDDRLKDQVVDVLLAARDTIAEPGGWCQGALGAYYEDHGAVCALGAVARAVRQLGFSGDVATRPELTAVKEVSTESRSRCDLIGVSSYNDLPSTTQADVVDLFDAAATRLKG